MKRIWIFIMLLCLICSQAFGAYEWTKAQPAGTTNASDIDYYVATTNNEALDRLLSKYQHGASVSYVSTSSLSIGIGEVACSSNAGVRKFRANTAAVTITASDLDVGAFDVSKTYYVYAVADADATTFTGKISLNATAPAGVTYYRRLASFTTNASSEVVNDDSLINYNNTYALKLGDWVSKSGWTTYQASTDGILVGWNLSNDQFNIYSDSTAAPTTARCLSNTSSGTAGASGCCPIKKGDYYKVESNAAGNTLTIFWLPLEKEN